MTCPTCNGEGQAIYSCCTGEPVTGEWEDMQMCPVCREHLGEQPCEECNGSGEVEDEEN